MGDKMIPDQVDRYLWRVGDENDSRRGSAECGIALSPTSHSYQSATIKVL